MSNLEGDINYNTEQLFNYYAEWISDISYGYNDKLADNIEKWFFVKF